ncbi:hypothetical protein K470DRAFT_110182 [Piedraia hortae CBS 480.64]|uniref:Uncharacterized protein n=1 Tax=Piedraia hortae CBS 480.64 TaxID=1314780 RepID=A0A6A7BVC8_9PEZI|nr:hypothetical protein K470DRAFT_110182 [Piedraia hortae CBS 480.64]
MAVEVRLNNQEDAEKTVEEKLKTIKQSIPDAKDTIPHPRAEGKVLVAVGLTMRRDQNSSNGLSYNGGCEIICRPKLFMVMGVPLDTRITNRGGLENNE